MLQFVKLYKSFVEKKLHHKVIKFSASLLGRVNIIFFEVIIKSIYSISWRGNNIVFVDELLTQVMTLLQ